jgi:MFS family permease
MAIFFIFSIACAVAQDTAQLAVFRFLSGLGGGAPLAIGAGVLSDMWEAKERGKAVAVFSLGPPIAPTVAPIIAGFISLRTTWRWVMWVLVFATGFTFVFGMIFLSETFPPIILGRKAKKLRKETGNKELKTIFEATEEGETLAHKVAKNLIRPAKLLSGNAIVFVLSLYMALSYGDIAKILSLCWHLGYIYLLFTTFPVLFGTIYGENVGIIGLNYIGLGIGSLFGFCSSLIANKVYQRLTDANNGKGLPEFRLPTLFVTAWFLPIALFWYGWSAQAHTRWILPVIGGVWFGVGIVSIFVAIQNYLVDGFRYAASALAAATVLRSLFGYMTLIGKSYILDLLFRYLDIRCMQNLDTVGEILS